MKIYRRISTTIIHLLPAALTGYLKSFVLAVCCVGSSVHASEAFQLDSQQMDGVTAGSTPQLAASVHGTAEAIGGSLVLADVRTKVDAGSRAEGKYRIDSVFASGASVACCEGGSTSLEIEVSSDAETQVGFVRVFSLDSSLMSIKIGAGAIIGISPI